MRIGATQTPHGRHAVGFLLAPTAALGGTAFWEFAFGAFRDMATVAVETDTQAWQEPMRQTIHGWLVVCVALGLAAVAQARATQADGPPLGGLQVGMNAREADAVAGASLDKVSPSEWYLRGQTYGGRSADLWIYRNAGEDRIQSLRWRQDIRFAPASNLEADLPALIIEKAPSDEGCTEALMQLAGAVRPFSYVGREGSFQARFGGQLAEVGFSPTDIQMFLGQGQAFAEGFESAEPASFGCNFIFNAQHSIGGRGFEATAFADVRLDWSVSHQRWRMYRMALQIDVRRAAN